MYGCRREFEAIAPKHNERFSTLAKAVSKLIADGDFAVKAYYGL